jgi:hypothetical protein
MTGREEWYFAKLVPHAGTLHEDFNDCCEPRISLPYSWSCFGDEDGNGGPAVKDPLMLYVCAPGMGVAEEIDPNAPTWCQPLGAIVDDVIEGHEEGDGKLSPDALKMVSDIRDALQALTDKLSAEITARTRA